MGYSGVGRPAPSALGLRRGGRPAPSAIFLLGELEGVEVGVAEDEAETDGAAG